MEHAYLKQGYAKRVAVVVGINFLAVPALAVGDAESLAVGFRLGVQEAVGADICQSCEVEVASIAYDIARGSAMAWLGAAAALTAVGATQKGIRRLALIGAGVAVVQAAGCDAIARGIDRVMSDREDDGGDDPDEDDTGPSPTWN
jgi:hypothetical protein